MSARRPAELVGLVLAGGFSRRMARDKGGLELRGRTQVESCAGLLEPLCTEVRVSVRAAQADAPAYRHLPKVIDSEDLRGPAAGLDAAWQQFPDCALLVLAVDMPLVDQQLLNLLVERRNPAKSATAFRQPGGLIEPLCTIWEPALAAVLRLAEPRGAPSLRRLLEGQDVELIDPPEPRQLESVNTPEAFARVQRGRQNG